MNAQLLREDGKVVYMHNIFGNKKAILGYNDLPILFVVSAIIQLYAPYQSNSPMHNDAIGKVVVYLQYAMVAIEAILVLKHRYIKIENLIPVIACVIAFWLPIINSYINSGFSGFLMFLLMVAYLLTDYERRKQTFIYFRKVWIVVCVVGIICYLAYLVSLPLPYRELNYYNMGLESLGIYQRYISYGIAFMHKSGSMIRLCGICNEPGLFGTICALFLCADGVDLKRKSNWIIFVAAIMSASLAFVLLLAVGVLFKSIEKPKLFLLTILGVVLFVFVLPNITTGNMAVDYLLQRLVLADRGLGGFDRSDDIIDSLVRQMLYVHPFWGFGNGYAALHSGRLVYKLYLIDYGILGFAMLYGSMFISAIYLNKREVTGLYYIIIFFISVYQRPNIFTLHYMILLFGGMAFASSGKEGSKLEIEGVP